MRLVLWSRGFLVAKTLQRASNVSGNGYLDLPLGIVPVQGESVIFLAFPVLRHFIVSFKDRQEMFGVLLANVLHTKVVNAERKCDGAPGMMP